MDNPLKTLLPEPGQQPSEAHVEPAAQPEPQVQAADPQAEHAQAPQRGPDGKFAPKPAEAAMEPTSPPAGQVPISALLDEREQRQSAQKQAKELQDRLAALERQSAEPAPAEEQFQAALYAQNLRVSRRFAERQYGQELTATVHEWAAAKCDADPIFNASIRSSDDPYEAAVQAYNRDQLVAKVSPERLAAFEAWEKAQAELQGQAQTVQQPAAEAPLPRSLADAPGNGAAGAPHIPVGPGEAFNAAISR